MSFAQKLERLTRIVPGVAGYQDKETSRDTDKTIRLRLVTELEQIKRDLEEDKKQLMEKRNLSLLPALDRVASKLDKLGNLVKYAGRGYRGFFDTYKLDQKKLDQLYTFDLGLLDGVEAIKTQAKQVHESHGDTVVLKKTIDDMDRFLDQLEKIFSTRQDILTTK
mgnify:CR=1 FL=1